MSAGLLPSEASLLAPGGRLELWPFLDLSVDVPVPSPSPSLHGGLLYPLLSVSSPFSNPLFIGFGARTNQIIQNDLITKSLI